MKVLIVGSGGREHALAWKVAGSQRVSEVLIAPGNAGTATEPRCRNVPIPATDLAALREFARRERVDLTIVGPEAPLVAGIVDEFTAAGLRCFGPTRACARLEGSKAFAKEFLSRHRIPTAGYLRLTRSGFRPQALRAQRTPLVVKADGLAAGKGVVIAATHAEALATIEAMFGGAFGAAGETVVVEEFLPGEEVSFIVVVDGEHVLPLASSQDHKRLLAGDLGPNTGGMGAYSPAPIVTGALHERIMAQVIAPTVAGLKAEGTPYVGFLYAGLMIAADGTPNVLEFNCRFGDPETQPILMRLESDLTELIDAALEGRLDRVQASWDPRPAVGVVLAAPGYPEQPALGAPIEGLARAATLPGKVFHAGTRTAGAQVLTAGGRVLCAVGRDSNLRLAQQQAYALVDALSFPGMQYRRDIGHRALAREAGG